MADKGTVTKKLKLKELYPTPKELNDKINAFFEEYRADTVRKPSIEWFCIYLGIDYNTWLNYVKGSQLTIEKQYGTDYKEIVDILTRAKLMLLASAVDLSCGRDTARGGLAAVARMGMETEDDKPKQVNITLGDTLDKFAK